MLRPLPGARTLSGWRAPASTIDYSARLRTYSESVASKRREVNELEAQFQRERAEIRANPAVAPYAVRKAFFNNEEAERRLAKAREVKEKRIQIQRAEAEAAAAIAEKRRSELPLADSVCAQHTNPPRCPASWRCGVFQSKGSTTGCCR
jgi:DNA segregation ATPase FtsK/SpoIIIE-like protein